MKTKSKVLIGLMALCLAGGVSTAFALTATPANGKVSQNVDGAVVFSFQDEDIPAISELKGGVDQYTFFYAQTDSTKGVSGTVTLTFELTAVTTKEGKTATLEGLTVSVYSADESVTAGNASTYCVAGNLEFELDEDNLSDTAEFEVETDTAEHITKAYYVMKFSLDGSTIFGADEVLDGQVEISAAWSN